MKDDVQNKIFARNLNHYVNLSGKQQKEIAKDLGFNFKTFNGWCKGLSIPTMGKVQTLADYFKIGKSDLLEDKKIEELSDPQFLTLKDCYNDLNDSGRKKLLDYANDLVSSGNYKKEKDNRDKELA